jgi:archaeal flagellin FlaB
MLRKLFRIHRNEKGITGLETAIILIAFVVVAAVFAYTVLSAGLFSTQKSSEAVYNGLKQSSSTLETRGGLIAYKGVADTAGDVSVGKVEFTVSNSTTQGTDAVDLTAPYTVDGTGLHMVDLGTPTQITFTDENGTVARCAWTLSWIGDHSPATGDYLLDPGEQAVITIWFQTFNGTIFAKTGTEANGFIGDNAVDTYHQFTLEVKTPSGAVLTLQRTTPALLDTVMDLH